MVGTWKGSNESISSRSIGTEIRPVCKTSKRQLFLIGISQSFHFTIQLFLHSDKLIKCKKKNISKRNTGLWKSSILFILQLHTYNNKCKKMCNNLLKCHIREKLRATCDVHSHQFWDGHWKDFSVNGWLPYWHLHPIWDSSTEAWSLYQYTGILSLRSPAHQPQQERAKGKKILFKRSFIN